jgi:hypothetical protein
MLRSKCFARRSGLLGKTYFSAAVPMASILTLLAVPQLFVNTRFCGICSGVKAAQAVKKAAADDKAVDDAEALLASVTDADLKAGESMSPLLRYNENLINASLALVEYANTNENNDVTPAIEEKIGAVMQMVFEEGYVPLEEQVATVRALLAVPEVRASAAMRDAAHGILAALVPDVVLKLVVAVDCDIEHFDAAAVESVDRFVALVVQGGDREDEFVAALQSLQTNVPHIDQSTQFIVLLQQMNSVLLQARLAALLTEACLSFDPARTGRIKRAELEESLRRVMPGDAVDKVMLGVEADDDGTVSYAQMGRILLRGENIQVRSATVVT